MKTGGAGRDRTDDLKLAKLALSQLSYGPILAQRNGARIMVGPVRFELTTPRLSSVCSDQLSYEPLEFSPGHETYPAIGLQSFEEGMQRRREAE